MSSIDNSCLALITARAGSKGLPGKNIIPLCGKPLIAYSIKAALEAKLVDRVVVSTDGEEIAKAAIAHGAEVPFMRPAELSADTSPHIDAVRHALETLAAEDPPYRPKWVALLQPTSPFSTSADIDAAVTLALRPGCRSVISVRKAQQHPFKMFCADGEGALETLVISNTAFPKNVEYLRRQDLPEAYQENGAIYLHRAEDILSCKGGDLPFRKHCRGDPTRAASAKLQSTELCYGYVMPSERSLDIDNYGDLELAEMQLRKTSPEGAPEDDKVLHETAAKSSMHARISELEEELQALRQKCRADGGHPKRRKT